MRTRLSKLLVPTLVVLALLLSGTFPAIAGPGAAPARYIVVMKPVVDAGAVARGHGAAVSHIYTHALNGFAAPLSPAQLQALATDPRVAYVEPDLVVHTCEQALPTGVDRIDADLNVTADIDGIDDVRVDVDIAIIDTGIDKDHPDLYVVGGRRFYTVNTGPPWERGTYEDDNYDDDNGHGSHVAGSAAALDNTEGVVGVAPGARLWGVKVLDASGSGYLSDVIAGIDWVTQNAGTIEVANMSLSWQGNSSAAREAIQNSVGDGVVYVVAAGNDAEDVYGPDGTFGTSDDFEPASYPEVATISAMADSDGQPGGTGSSTSYGADDSFASFSNYSGSVVGNNPVTSPGAAIDLLMPGVDIYSTYKDGGYATGSGTSMSSPHGAGLAALYIAVDGRATNATGVHAIRQALIDGGVAQNSLQGLATLNDPDSNWENIGWAGPLGPVDYPPTVNITNPTDGSMVSGTVDLTADASDDNGVTQVEFFVDGFSVGVDTDGTDGWSTTWDTSATDANDDPLYPDGDYTITAAATDTGGQTASDSISATVDNVNDPPVATFTYTCSGLTCNFDASGSDDPDGTIATYEWSFGDGNTGSGVIANHTYAVAGTYAVVLTVTDDDGANGTDRQDVTVSEAAETMHVGDLDGVKDLKGTSGRWEVFVTVTIHDENCNPVANATVSGEWSGATTGTVSGSTGSDGTVTLSTGNMSGGTEVTFTVTGVTHDILTYDGTANHEPDGDSDGTSITVLKP